MIDGGSAGVSVGSFRARDKNSANLMLVLLDVCVCSLDFADRYIRRGSCIDQPVFYLNDLKSKMVYRLGRPV